MQQKDMGRIAKEPHLCIEGQALAAGAGQGAVGVGALLAVVGGDDTLVALLLADVLDAGGAVHFVLGALRGAQAVQPASQVDQSQGTGRLAEPVRA